MSIWYFKVYSYIYMKTNVQLQSIYTEFFVNRGLQVMLAVNRIEYRYMRNPSQFSKQQNSFNPSVDWSQDIIVFPLKYST